MFFLMQGTQEDFKQYVAQEDNHYQAYIEEDNHEIEQFKELQHQNKKGQDRLCKQKFCKRKKQVEIQKGLHSTLAGGSKKQVSYPINI